MGLRSEMGWWWVEEEARRVRVVGEVGRVKHQCGDGCAVQW